jgi:hypothetical protein
MDRGKLVLDSGWRMIGGGDWRKDEDRKRGEDYWREKKKAELELDGKNLGEDGKLNPELMKPTDAELSKARAKERKERKEERTQKLKDQKERDESAPLGGIRKCMDATWLQAICAGGSIGLFHRN